MSILCHPFELGEQVRPPPTNRAESNLRTSGAGFLRQQLLALTPTRGLR